MSNKTAWLTAKQAAKIVGISPGQFRKRIREGNIKAEKVGTEYIVDPANIKNVKRRRAKKDGNK